MSEFDEDLAKWLKDLQRMREALRKIAAYERGGCLGSDADEMIDIAREAISPRTN